MTQINAQSGLWNNANNTKQVIVAHTTESATASGALAWMKSQRNGSYQDLVDSNGDIYLMVPDDKQAWAAMSTGNRIGLHSCSAGYARFSRQDWLGRPKQLDSTALVWAQWSAKYGIPLVKLTPAQVRAGQRGICGHVDISRAFGESDHTDPGNNYPYDVVIAKASALLSGVDAKAVNSFTAMYMAAIGSDVKDVRDQVCGGRDAFDFHGWPQLGGRTFTDGVAAVLAELSKR